MRQTLLHKVHITKNVIKKCMINEGVWRRGIYVPKIIQLEMSLSKKYYDFSLFIKGKNVYTFCMHIKIPAQAQTCSQQYRPYGQSMLVRCLYDAVYY